MTRVAEFVDRVSAHVVIGEHETVRGDKCPRAPGTEPDTRALEVLKPLGSESHPVVALDPLQRRGREEPHSLVAESRRSSMQRGNAHARDRHPHPT